MPSFCLVHPKSRLLCCDPLLEVCLNFHPENFQEMQEIPCPCSESKKQCEDESIYQLRGGPRTDEIYRTCNLPFRFMYPKVFRGYRQEADDSKPHPCYRSTSMDYGWYSPTIHTVPTAYYPRSTAFSNELGRAGMYRNRSLNTELDKTLI